MFNRHRVRNYLDNRGVGDVLEYLENYMTVEEAIEYLQNVITYIYICQPYVTFYNHYDGLSWGHSHNLPIAEKYPLKLEWELKSENNDKNISLNIPSKTESYEYEFDIVGDSVEANEEQYNEQYDYGMSLISNKEIYLKNFKKQYQKDTETLLEILNSEHNLITIKKLTCFNEYISVDEASKLTLEDIAEISYEHLKEIVTNYTIDDYYNHLQEQFIKRAYTDVSKEIFLRPEELYVNLSALDETKLAMKKLEEIVNHYNVTKYTYKLNMKLDAGNDDESSQKIFKDVIDLLEIDILAEDEYGYWNDEFTLDRVLFSAGLNHHEDYMLPVQLTRLMEVILRNYQDKPHTLYDPKPNKGALIFGLSTHDTTTYIEESNSITLQKIIINTAGLLAAHNISIDYSPNYGPAYFDHFDNYYYETTDALNDNAYADKQFDIVVTQLNSSKWNPADKLSEDPRFKKYELAPKNNSDYAYILHMLNHLKKDGIMLVLTTESTLYKGGASGKIRKQIIEKDNYIDSVIKLPKNALFSTSKALVLIVFKKNKENEDILFIDASSDYFDIYGGFEFEKVEEVYKNRESEYKYSHKASKEEIISNNYNLNISRYVNKYEESNIKSLNAIINSLNEINEKIEENNWDLERLNGLEELKLL